MVTKPVKITNVTSMMPKVTNEIIHAGEPNIKVKVAHMPVTMNSSLKVGRKSLIMRNKPLMTMPSLKSLEIRDTLNFVEGLCHLLTVCEGVVHKADQALFLLVILHHYAESDQRQRNREVERDLSHVSRVE